GPALAEEGKKKDEPKKAEQKRKLPEVDQLFPDFDGLLDEMPGLDADALAELKKQMAQHRKLMEDMLRRQPRVGRRPALPNLPACPGGGFGALGRPGRADGSQQEGRLGVQLRKPSAALADQLDLPKGQGMVVEEVGPNSPAAKAGVKANDILLELDGKAVS